MSGAYAQYRKYGWFFRVRVLLSHLPAALSPNPQLSPLRLVGRIEKSGNFVGGFSDTSMVRSLSDWLEPAQVADMGCSTSEVGDISEPVMQWSADL